jgi:hypothetical protein
MKILKVLLSVVLKCKLCESRKDFKGIRKAAGGSYPKLFVGSWVETIVLKHTPWCPNKQSQSQ